MPHALVAVVERSQLPSGEAPRRRKHCAKQQDAPHMSLNHLISSRAFLHGGPQPCGLCAAHKDPQRACMHKSRLNLGAALWTVASHTRHR